MDALVAKLRHTHRINGFGITALAMFTSVKGADAKSNSRRWGLTGLGIVVECFW